MIFHPLQAAGVWLSAGKFLFMEEIHLIAEGDEKCTIAIEKTSMS